MAAGGPLSGCVCVVTGASQGLGKGIALQLAAAGATVYVTGRRAEALARAAAEVSSRGGRCVAVVCDSSQDEQVAALLERVRQEQGGRLDVLVSCAFSGVEAIVAQQGRPFWESPATLWDDINNVGLRGHYLSLRHAARLMVSAGHGLLVVVSSPGGLGYMFNVPYGVGKAACDRLVADCAHELHAYGVACVALWPGMVRTEKVLKEQHGTGPMAEKIQVMMGMSETPEASGKCVVALAADPHIMAHSGKVLLTPDLARHYGFQDVDGKPIFNYMAVRNVLTMLKPQLSRFFRLIPECLTVPKWVIALYASKFRAYSALEPAPLPKKQD